MEHVLRRLGTPLPSRYYRIGFVALFSGWLAVVALCRASTTDAGQLKPATHALLGLHLSHAYPARAHATSPPGYPIVVALPYAIGSLVFGGRAYELLGLMTPLAVAAAAVYLGRAIGVCSKSAGELLLIAVTLASPAVGYALIGEAFHPQDLLALAFCLVAVRLAVTDQVRLAGVTLGMALLTRQWAVLVALPLVAAVPNRRSELALLAGAVVAAGLLPFVIADHAAVFAALTAREFTTSVNSLVQKLPFVSREAASVARVGPVVMTAAICGVLALRWRRNAPPAPIMVAGAVTACLASRVLLDSIYLYYLAPLAVFLAVTDAATRWRGLRAALWIALLWDVWVAPGTTPTGDTVHALALFVLFAAAFVAALVVAWGRQIASPLERAI